MSDELKKRVFTGVLGGALLLGLIIFGGRVGMAILISILSLGMIFEFTEMTFTMPDRVEKRYLLWSLTWFVELVNLLAPQVEFGLLTVTFLCLFIYFLFSAKRYSEAEFSTHFKELAFSVFAVVYLVFLPIYFMKIYELANGMQWVLVFLLINWAGDSAAYFVGTKYGRHKLYPLISPKKSVEGGWGGIGAGVGVALISKALFFHSMPWGAVFVLPVIVGAAAQLGDFCESFFKRAFFKKDSGSILPGHGGFLDRFDGVVFSLPVMYACIRVLG